MTRRAVVWAVLAVVGVVGLVAGLGYDERARQDGEPGALERLLIGEQRPGTSYSVAISFDPDTGVWRAGERTWRSGPMAKTQVAAYDVMTCTLNIQAPEDQSEAPVNIMLGYGCANLNLLPSGNRKVLGVTYYVYDVFIGNGYDLDEYAGQILMEADGEVHQYECELKYPGVVECTVAEDPIGDKSSATHAKERTATDAWSIPTADQLTVTVGAVSRSVSFDGTFGRRLSVGFVAFVDSNGHPAYTGELVRVANISVNGAAIDASELDRTLEPTATFGSYTGKKLRLHGEGADIVLDQEEYVGTSVWLKAETVTPPIVHSFSGLHVTDMDGADLSDLVLWFTGAQWYNANTEEWEYRGYTLAEWQALTLVPNYGLYSWDPQPPPDGALRTLATAGFYIDRDSARAHQLDGFAETA